MPRKNLWIAAGCILALTGLFPIFSSGESAPKTEKILYSFSGGADGGQPVSGLTFDSAGNLYGTTSQGGNLSACNEGCGTVFELKRTAEGWTEQVLYSFTGTADGGGPRAGVILDNAGSLYGTTAFGGIGDSGTVFKLTQNTRGSWAETVLYSFTGFSDGFGPQADLVFDARGNLYGTTPQGGSSGKSCRENGCGVVFALTPQTDGSWTETTVHAFAGAPDGATPSSGLILDSAGNLYGATKSGGTGSCYLGAYIFGITFGCGTIYKLTDSGGTWTDSVLYNFVRGSGFGIYPSGEFLFENADSFFGVTRAGGDGAGTVLELRDTAKRGWQQSGAHIFFGQPGDGAVPTGRLVTDSSGNCIGITSSGGANGNGTVFELQRLSSGWRERVVYSFAGSLDGATPQAGLVSDSNGHFYGTTQHGGTSTTCNQGCGTLYEVTP